MKVALSKIASEFSELITELKGKDIEVTNIAPADRCGPGDLVFIARSDFTAAALKQQPAAVVADAKDSAPFTEAGIPVLVSSQVPLAHALIRQTYADRNVRDSEWGTIHPSAVIHKSAQLGGECIVGPGAVIGRDCKLGERVVVMAGVVIENNVSLGGGTVIHPNCVIGYNTEVGSNCIIKAGSTIAMEGFGFEQDARRASHRVPQTGRVVIEDDVVVGANNCIDRATYHETRIGRGTKFDNLCHVAHNVQIGEDCLLTAGFIVAGSTTIGDRVIASGQTGVLDHLNVCADSIFVHRAGITTDVTEPGVYAGLPLQPLQPYLKNAAINAKLGELRKRVRDLEKQIASTN